MLTHSIRWRLLLWLGFLLVCVLTGFGFTVYQLQRVNQNNQLDEELERRIEALVISVRPSIPFRPTGGRGPFDRQSRGEPGDSGPLGFPTERRGPGPDESRLLRRGRMESGGPEMMTREFKLPPEFAALFNEAAKDGYYYAVWFGDGSTPKFSANAPAAMSLPERLRGESRRPILTRGNYREAFRFTGMGDCVLAGRSILAQRETERRFALMLLAAGGALLAFGLGVSWWLTTRAIRPVEAISAAANRISAGNLSERITIAEPRNELGRLAGVLNSTFGRLETAFAQQKQFTADASHELRTPLAVIISEAQTTLSRPRNADEYRETIETCLEAAQEMRRLAQSLLELSRFDAGQERIERQPFDLSDCTRAAVELIRPLARDRGLNVSCELPPVEALGDAGRISQVITNLLTNAIHYNKERGEIRIATRAENGRAVLTVADTGQGIGAEDLPHVFERFYRADKSRAHGQSGLGLAICQAIIDAHGGSIEVSSKPGEGATFTVRLPRACD